MAYQRANDQGYAAMADLVTHLPDDVGWSPTEHVVHAHTPNGLARLAQAVRVSELAGSPALETTVPLWATGQAWAWSNTALVQPVSLARALAHHLKSLGGHVLTNAPVHRIHATAEGVTIELTSGDELEVVTSWSPRTRRSTTRTGTPCAPAPCATTPSPYPVDGPSPGTTVRGRRRVDVDPSRGPARRAPRRRRRRGEDAHRPDPRRRPLGRPRPPGPRRIRRRCARLHLGDAGPEHPRPAPIRRAHPPRTTRPDRHRLRGWGFANAAAVAATLPAILDTGTDQDSSSPGPGRIARALEARRLWPHGGVAATLSDGAWVASSLTGDTLRATGHLSNPSPDPGQGQVVGGPLHPKAVSTSPDGSVHVLSARCTHLGCLVRWNTWEQSWDCPCHGSRFAPDGSVLHGPASQPLAHEAPSPDDI